MNERMIEFVYELLNLEVKWLKTSRKLASDLRDKRVRRATRHASTTAKCDGTALWRRQLLVLTSRSTKQSKAKQKLGHRPKPLCPSN